MLTPMKKMLVFFVLSLSFSAATYASELNFSLLVINGNQRTAYLEQVQIFENQNPDIKVNIQGVDPEEYKEKIESWLNQPTHSDVMYWFGGQRLNWFASKGLIEPIDNLWASENWNERFTKASQSAVKIGANFYGIPVHYYNWGMYFNKDIFKKLSLMPPTTWGEFLQICEVLKQNNITPLVLGSKEVWPTAGWFDYINLRVNGLQFHQDLLGGKVSYLDPRVRDVFEKLKILIERGYFMKDHQDLTWKDSLPYLYRDFAGMMLMGNFWTSQLPEPMAQKISVFAFPVIDPAISFYEEAPTNVLFIPKNAQNKENAIRFLRFMAKQDVQRTLNENLGMLAPQPFENTTGDHFLIEGQKILSRAQGLSQYYDRDSPLPIALDGMKEIKAFFLEPQKLEQILEKLETLRKQSFPEIVNNEQQR